MELEIISRLVAVEGEWLGEHVYGFICKTSSAAIVEESHWKRPEAAGSNTLLWEWGKLMNWEDGRGKNREGMTPDSEQRQRAMVMSSANDRGGFYWALWGAPALGIVSRTYFRCCSPNLTCSLSADEYIEDIWEAAAHLPAEGVISASGWGAKVRSGQWEGR